MQFLLNFVKFFFIFMLVTDASQAISTNHKDQAIILTTISPVAALIKDLAGEEVQVDYLIKSGNIHDYSPKIGDLKNLKKAAYLVTLGEDFEPFIAKFTNKIEPSKIMDLSRINGVKLINARNSCNCHHLEHAHLHHHDPHFWLGIDNAQIIAKTIVEILINIKPEAKHKFEQNLADFNNKLSLIKHNFLNKKLTNTQYLITHDSLQYLEKDLNIKLIDTIFNDHYQQIKTKKIIQLKKTINKQQVKCLLVDTELDNKTSRKLAHKLELTPHLINIEGNGQKNYQSNLSYVKLYNEIVNQLTNCLE